MKEVILSADGDSVVYLVPDAVAKNLRKYCIHFCDKWMKTSPDAKEYKIKGGCCFCEADFIDYLNEYLFPNEKSVLEKIWGGQILEESFQPNIKTILISIFDMVNIMRRWRAIA